MNTLFNTQPPALQAEKLFEGESNCTFEKLAEPMAFQEKRQGTSGWTHPFWLLNFVFIALHTAQARIPEAMMDTKPAWFMDCLLYTSPSPRDKRQSRMPSSA